MGRRGGGPAHSHDGSAGSPLVRFWGWPLLTKRQRKLAWKIHEELAGADQAVEIV